ncbi:MAG: lipopolysaccharide export system permease protein [Cyclobacteriaceae bacterium]|jgi:lipopolysaccharide export system permease protein
MRRLDKLILKAFFGPFFLTTLVATFILLIQYMLKYFDDFVGKNLGAGVFAELLFYFSLNMLQVALPLGVLVSSLMTFGNLGEHFELTAIKSAGISLLRAMRPIFIFVIFLSIAAFFFNNYIVPAANLKAYSLLYDIKHKKPALDIQPGVFYDGIPNYSIKAGDKLPDNKTLLQVMIYDHTKRDGNKRVILADSSLMYTIFNDKYLKLELFNGIYYNEVDKNSSRIADLYRTRFDRLDIVFSLSSFDLKRTKEELFRNNRQMKNISQLSEDIDSLAREKGKQLFSLSKGGSSYLSFHIPKYLVDTSSINRQLVKEIVEIQDSIRDPKTTKIPERKFEASEKIDLVYPSTSNSTVDLGLGGLGQTDSTQTMVSKAGRELRARKLLSEEEDDIPSLEEWSLEDLNAYFTRERQKQKIVQNAVNKARNFKVNISGINIKTKSLEGLIDSFTVEKYKKYSQAFACIVMFLIGAPLGAIIKKGGLGVPVIVSIIFFIIYYVLTISSEKWAKADLVEGQWAVWTADLFLLPIGLFFMRQARIDARLFDTDFYLVVWEKIKSKRQKSKDLS